MRQELAAKRYICSHPVFGFCMNHLAAMKTCEATRARLTRFWYSGCFWIILIEEKVLLLVDGGPGCQ